MEIRIIGPGCPRCRRAAVEAEKAVGLAAVPAVVVRVEDLRELVALGVAATPAIVVNGVLKSAGRVASATEISTWLLDAAQ